MQLLHQPNCWSCSVTALAMVIDRSISEVISVIGHDGSEVVAPELPSSDPLRHHGFHLQELVDAAIWFGYRPIWIELEPVARIGNKDIDIHFRSWVYNGDIDIAPTCEFPGNLGRFQYYMTKNKGIILGENYHCCHWVAWDGRDFYDPAGVISKSLTMDILGFLAISNHD